LAKTVKSLRRRGSPPLRSKKGTPKLQIASMAASALFVSSSGISFFHHSQKVHLILHLPVTLYDTKRGFGRPALNLRNPVSTLLANWLVFMVALFPSYCSEIKELWNSASLIYGLYWQLGFLFHSFIHFF
jgi:hypothetical protein